MKPRISKFFRKALARVNTPVHKPVDVNDDPDVFVPKVRLLPLQPLQIGSLSLETASTRNLLNTLK